MLDESGRDLVETYDDEAPWILRENRLFLPLRARFVEDRLAEAYARGVRQYVILGAGLDSYAWRQPDGQGALRMYEVDHPSTQRWKVDRLTGLGWPLPPNARMVACDFEATTASEALAATDFDASRPTVVSWMGVVYYLDGRRPRRPSAISTILAPGVARVRRDAPWRRCPSATTPSVSR